MALLAHMETEALPVHLVHHAGRHVTQKVRAFPDLAPAALLAHPALR
jgi:hypothetical protein